MFSSKDLFFTPAVSTGYTVSKSLRFRSSASTYLSKSTYGSGSMPTFTWAAWIKRGTLGVATQILFTSTDRTDYYDWFGFNSSNQLNYTHRYNNADATFTTSAIFRDPSAWYHVVVAVDSTQASNSNRVKIYVNSVLQTVTTSGTFTQSQDVRVFNTASASSIGGPGAFTSNYFDGYLAETYLIYNSAKTPTDFGAYDTNGVWQPAAYTGTYGTNGFYLKFTTVGATSGSNTGYGQDFSGNGNYWTTNNFGTTSTATTYDSMLDSPTNATGDIGNYCVMNPLDKGLGVTVADGNLSGTFGVGSVFYGILCGSMGVNSGKWYWEAQITANGGSAGQAPLIGITDINTSITSTAPINTSTGAFDSKTFGYYGGTGNKKSSAGVVAYGATFTTGDIIGVALDMDAGTLTFYKNNTSQGTAFSSGIAGNTMTPALLDAATGGTDAINFGQRPFAYTPPSGFSALNTQNLTTPTISNGASYMAAVTYQGATAPNTVTTTSSNSGNNPNGVSFQPDLVWIKSRSAATDHKWTDAVRGTTKALVSNSTAAETTDTNGLTAFTASGFTVGSDTTYNNTTGPATYVAWEWNAGGSNATNTSGSITSTVRANTSAGFSVVTYTGTGANATVGHGLGVAPSMVIIFERSPGGDDHIIYHSNLTSNQYSIRLNTTAAQAGPSANYWNSTSPSSTVFSLGISGECNQSTATYVAYCFAPVAGYSAFGSYTGNGSADGPFIYTGFRPRWIIGKCSSAATSDWFIYDTSRATYNASTARLYADTSGAETTGLDIDILSNGFKFRALGGQGNDSGSTYIFAAFAENPFKISRAR